MIFDLQKASTWKRISAGLFDGIILGIAVVGLAFVFSVLFKYDGYNQTLNDSYAGYEKEYGIVFDITAEQYENLSSEALAKYHAAYDALIADDDSHLEECCFNLQQGIELALKYLIEINGGTICYKS